MIEIYSRPDLYAQYDEILKAFLTSEHVNSETEWIELFKEINNCSYETAQNELVLILDTFIKLREIETDDAVKNIILRVKDTSCLCLTKTSIAFLKSLKNELINNFDYIKNITYSEKHGQLIVSGVENNKTKKLCVYKALSSGQEERVIEFIKTNSKKPQYEIQSFLLEVWNDKTKTSIFEKIF